MNTYNINNLIPPSLHTVNLSCSLQLYHDGVDGEDIMKMCPSCEEYKKLQDFSISKRNKYGRSYNCKKCKSLESLKRAAKLSQRDPETILYPETKLCPKCQVIKNSEEFHKNISNKDGLHYICAQCNIKRVSEYSKTRKEDVNRRSREYKRRHPEKRAAMSSKRRANKKDSTHPNINQSKVNQLYSECRELTLSTGIDYHVDHIFPLGKAPKCKIHHEDNLQIIQGEINLNKNDSLTFTHPDIKHWTQLPDHILNEIDEDILQKAWLEWDGCIIKEISFDTSC